MRNLEDEIESLDKKIQPIENSLDEINQQELEFKIEAAGAQVNHFERLIGEKTSERDRILGRLDALNS